MFKLQLNDAKKMIRALWFLFHHRSIHTKLVTNPGKKKKRVSLGNGMCKYSKKKRKKISRCLMCRKYSFIFCHFFEVKKKKKKLFSTILNRQREIGNEITRIGFEICYARLMGSWDFCERRQGVNQVLIHM